MTKPPHLPDPRPAGRPDPRSATRPGRSAVPRGRGPLIWVALGFLVGFVAGVVISSRAPEVASYSPRTSALFIGSALGLLGGVLGAVGFALLDLLRQRADRR